MSAHASNSAVIARLDRATQYAAASRFKFEASGILDPRFRGDGRLVRADECRGLRRAGMLTPC